MSGYLIGHLDQATKELNEYMQSLAPNAEKRKRAIENMRAGRETAEYSSVDLEGAAQTMLEVERALARFDNARKNAETVLTAMLAKARKDMETISQYRSEAQASGLKAENLRRELVGAMEHAVQKAKFPLLDVRNLREQFYSERKLNVERLKKEIFRPLEDLANNLEDVEKTLTIMSAETRAFRWGA